MFPSLLKGPSNAYGHHCAVSFQQQMPGYTSPYDAVHRSRLSSQYGSLYPGYVSGMGYHSGAAANRTYFYGAPGGGGGGGAGGGRFNSDLDDTSSDDPYSKGEPEVVGDLDCNLLDSAAAAAAVQTPGFYDVYPPNRPSCRVEANQVQTFSSVNPLERMKSINHDGKSKSLRVLTID